jgi:hypothetical protein
MGNSVVEFTSTVNSYPDPCFECKLIQDPFEEHLLAILTSLLESGVIG